jgi:hypothetical protein
LTPNESKLRNNFVYSSALMRLQPDLVTLIYYCIGFISLCARIIKIFGRHALCHRRQTQGNISTLQSSAAVVVLSVPEQYQIVIGFHEAFVGQANSTWVWPASFV